MEIELIQASVQDAESIWKMQAEAFSGLLKKYRDYEISPGNEPVDKVRRRLEHDDSFFYYIAVDGQRVGAIRVVAPSDSNLRKRISPLFVMPEHRNCGIAQWAIKKVEELHGDGQWSLDTILQEKGNCHLYEKMGYHQTGETEVVNERMTLVFYEKD